MENIKKGVFNEQYSTFEYTLNEQRFLYAYFIGEPLSNFLSQGLSNNLALNFEILRYLSILLRYCRVGHPHHTQISCFCVYFWQPKVPSRVYVHCTYMNYAI